MYERGKQSKMAALVEGQHYGLSSLSATSADKTVVLVKLTDTALRTIEEFQKIKVCSHIFIGSVINAIHLVAFCVQSGLDEISIIG